MTPQQKWNKNHPQQMAENQRRFRKHNPLVVRKSNLKRYGLTPERFIQELVRQHHRCLGCLAPITEKTACVDHNHVTGVFRGLLCVQCNWALGNVRDTPMILRRLMAYLDHDRTKIHIYLAGALKNSRIPQIGNHLRQIGFDVMDEWFTPGEFADTNWQQYEKQRGRTYQEALHGRAATNVFCFDRAYLDLADVVILVMPAGKSAMLELGYAKGQEKRAYILLDGADPDRYDIMPNFADRIFQTEDDLIVELRRDYVESLPRSTV